MAGKKVESLAEFFCDNPNGRDIEDELLSFALAVKNGAYK